MPVTIAFDVYGTLIDTHGVVKALERHVGKAAGEFSYRWREKQLEYAFRRGLMKEYQNFSVCTANALDYTCLQFKLELSTQDKQELLQTYRILPAFDDVEQGLLQAKQAGFNIYAFSNGTADAVELLFDNAGISKLFLGIISVDEVKSFKPDAEVYRYFLKQTGCAVSDAWLISSNPFDVIGALSVGMRSAWLQRTPDMVFDPWDIQPTITVASLLDLTEKISQVVKSN